MSPFRSFKIYTYHCSSYQKMLLLLIHPMDDIAVAATIKKNIGKSYHFCAFLKDFPFMEIYKLKMLGK